MGRYVLLLLLLTACPKKQESETEPLPIGSAAPTGRSVTKVDAEGSGEGRLEKAAEGHQDHGQRDAGTGKEAPADARYFGGNGAKPYIDDEGHLHGPGGPIFMGRGPECNADVDHCMRDGVWFAVGNLVAGKLYRATPVFEYEGKWYNFRGKEEQFAMRFRTKVGTKETLKVGEPIIWFIDENSAKKFVDNEYEALTSSRWEAGYVEAIGEGKLRVQGWSYGAVPFDTTRVITERQ